MRPNIIIATDASVSQEGIAAYAFYIVAGGKAIRSSGVIEGRHKGSAYCELFAILSALKAVTAIPNYQSRHIELYSDSKGTVELIPLYITTGRGALKFRQNLHWVAGILKTLKSYELKWIPAHTQNKELPYMMNNWCDRAAGQIMRAEVAKADIEKHGQWLDNNVTAVNLNKS